MAGALRQDQLIQVHLKVGATNWQISHCCTDVKTIPKLVKLMADLVNVSQLIADLSLSQGLIN